MVAIVAVCHRMLAAAYHSVLVAAIEPGLKIAAAAAAVGVVALLVVVAGTMSAAASTGLLVAPLLEPAGQRTKLVVVAAVVVAAGTYLVAEAAGPAGFGIEAVEPVGLDTEAAGSAVAD